MRYLIKQKFFSFADNYYINDANGNPRFMVKSKFFTIGKKFWIYSMNGEELFYLRQRLFRFPPKYSIYKNGEEVGVFKSKIKFIRARARIESQFGNFTMKGSIMSWDFDVRDENDNLAMNISKHIMRIADTYTVDIADTYDNSFLLSMAIITDAIYQKKK